MVCGYVLIWLLFHFSLFVCFFFFLLTFAAFFAWCLLNKVIFGIQCNKPEPGFIRRNPNHNLPKLVGNFTLLSFGIDGRKLTCASSLLYSTVVILM